MRYLPILAALLALCAPALAMVGGAAPATDGIGRSLVMIVGSRAIVAGSRTNVCTGAALTRDLMLTAAHCVAPAATYNVFTARNAPALAIKTVQVHPRFDPQSFTLNRATADDLGTVLELSK